MPKHSKCDALAQKLLRLIVDSGRADGFKLIVVVGVKKISRYIGALYSLVNAGLVSRVPISCGEWFYKFTPAGHEAAKEE